MTAFAVIRHDYHEDLASDAEGLITVVEVLPSIEEAEREIQRLNALNADKACRYFWQATRWYPDGRGRVLND